jgi:hypothetical protein
MYQEKFGNPGGCGICEKIVSEFFEIVNTI